MGKFYNKNILLMVGFPGSGKSTLAQKLVKQFDYIYLSTDNIRQELFDSDRFDIRGNDFVKKISPIVYAELYKRAVSLVKKGKKVILDGTNLDAKKRVKSVKKLLKEIPKEQICFITVKTPPKVILERMSKHTEKYNEKENTFEAWQRVFNIFLESQKKGLLSWPDGPLGIDVVDSEEVYEELA